MKQLLCLLLLGGSSVWAQPKSQTESISSDAFYQQHKSTLLHQFGRFANEADLRFLLHQIIDRRHLEVDYNQYFRPNPAPLAHLITLRHARGSIEQIKASLVYPLLRFVLPRTIAKPTLNNTNGPGERIALQAHSYLGIAYGAPTYNRQTGQGTLDCSGLVRYVFEDLGINTRNFSSVASIVGHPDLRPVSGAPQPGDLLVRKHGNGPHGNGRWSHVGIYVGGGQLIEAPYSGTVVRVTPYKAAKWGQILRHVWAYDTRT